MSFTWNKTIVQYSKLDADGVQEIRDNVDWLDNKIVYCTTDNTSVYSINDAGVDSGNDITIYTGNCTGDNVHDEAGYYLANDAPVYSGTDIAVQGAYDTSF